MTESILPAREFVSAVRDYCVEHELLEPGSTVVVGVSGGPDSVALLLALHELSRPLDLKIRVAHLDHGLRKNSPADARFVLDLASRLGIPYATVGKAGVGLMSKKGNISLEEAGRLARYEFFLRTAKKFKAGYVAVGHNRDDQAETVLMRLLRGSSGSGLSGIEPRRVLVDGPGRGKPIWVIRPLLDRSRAEIEAFLRRRGQKARKDPTNIDTTFMRNRIRHDLLPLLEKKFNPRIRALLARAAQVLAEDDSYLEGAAEGLFKRLARHPGRVVSLDAAKLSRIALPLRRRVLQLAAVAGGADQKRVVQPHLDALIRLVSARQGSTHLPGAVAEVKGRWIRFYKK